MIDLLYVSIFIGTHSYRWTLVGWLFSTYSVKPYIVFRQDFYHLGINVDNQRCKLEVYGFSHIAQRLKQLQAIHRAKSKALPIYSASVHIDVALSIAQSKHD